MVLSLSTRLFVAFSACVTFESNVLFEIPELTLASPLICCSQLAIAVHTLLAYASFAFLSELPPPQPAATTTTTIATMTARSGMERMGFDAG